MFVQYPLPYAFDALAPHIDALTVETHYGKHHAAYTAAFNKAAEDAGLADKTAEEILTSLDSVSDPALKNALRNNGGGFYNHNLYFEQLSPTPASAPTGKLAEAIDSAFGSFDVLKEKLSAASVGQFGSGWGWLVADASGKLSIISTANQDTPITLGLTPIVAVDVWEHAYYLGYKNLRAAYVKELFAVIDWNVAAHRYEDAIN